MKLLFIFRDSYDARFILNKLNEAKLLDAAILEKGASVRAAKLKRMIRKTNPFYYPLLVLDLISLSIFTIFIDMFMSRRLGSCEYPEKKIKLIVDNANEDSCINFVKKYQPTAIFIYGTAILGNKFLNELKALTLNIHSGILPYYRNVHSDFWAFANEDFNKIGLSVIYVDKGIDSGDIALQKTIDYKKGDSLIDIKIKNLKLIPVLIKQIIKEIADNKLKRKKQDSGKSGFYNSPRFIDFVRLVIKPI